MIRFNSLFFLALIIPAALVLTSCGTNPKKQPPADTTANGINALPLEVQQQFLTAQQLMQKQQWREAHKILETLGVNYRTITLFDFNAALCEYQMGEYEKAQQKVELLLKSNSLYPQAHNLAGLIAQQQHDFTKAKSHLEMAVQLQPAYANALYNLALLHDVYFQDINSALPYYQKYLDLVSDDEETQGWVDQINSSLNM